MTRYEVIPAGYMPEDWAAFGPGVMAQLRTELALAQYAGSAPSLELNRLVALLEHGRLNDERLLVEIDARAEAETRARFVHTYKGEGLTACGLEVVGPCPDCATVGGARK